MVTFDELLAEAVGFHGHLCPGQVLGVRLATLGCRLLGLELPVAGSSGDLSPAMARIGG